MTLVPVVRSMQIARSIDFYTKTLDFELVGVWPALADPAFAILTRNGCELHLSSHGGDGIAGQSVTVLVKDVDAVFAAILARGHDPSARVESPIHLGPVDQTWGTREAVVDDPDGNSICFTQR